MSGSIIINPVFRRQSSFSHENEFYIEGQIESLDAGSKTLLRSVVSQTHGLKKSHLYFYT